MGSNNPSDAVNLWRFAYFLPYRSDRALLPHMLRDGDAALFVISALLPRGGRYAGIIFNYPSDWSALERSGSEETPPLGRDDMLILCTRPPLDDREEADKARVHGSCSALEAKVFACIRRHLPRCARSRIQVCDEHALAYPEVARRQYILLQQRHGAPIYRFRARGDTRWLQPPPGDRSSVAFLIYEDQLWPGGPALLAAWGMCGVDSLIWTSLLATRFRRLLGTVPFVMAELTPPPKSASRPATLADATKWQVRLLTHKSPSL